MKLRARKGYCMDEWLIMGLTPQENIWVVLWVDGDVEYNKAMRDQGLWDEALSGESRK
jgi:hypothetical protein